jgi:poly-gamma-glutamate synthesis protein (capsule biosynthesis protein)
MLGRGVDQILPCPGDPTLQEPGTRDARDYVVLAEAMNGPIPRPVDFSWPWGDALNVLEESAPDVRVVNLETSITRRGEVRPSVKSVHYRMNPRQHRVPGRCRPDVCVLANNHVLDFGYLGLDETLGSLAGVGLAVAGAGRDASEAGQPAAVSVGGGGRVLVFSFGSASSGIPPEWAATGAIGRASTSCPDLSEVSAARIAGRVEQVKQPGDVVVASVHWGSNWGLRHLGG